MNTKKLFKTQDLALISVFSALWIGLNLVVAPLSFILTGLPVIHDFLVFFLLLIVVWATGKFGAASFVGVVGSIIVLFAGGPPPMVGFAACAILFDFILILNHHKLTTKLFSIVTAVMATVLSAYVAANINGLIILGFQTAFSATVWSAENLVGAVLSLVVAWPIIGLLERSKVQQIKT